MKGLGQRHRVVQQTVPGRRVYRLEEDNTMKRALLVMMFVGVAAAIAAPAQAQMLPWEDHGFLNVDFGVQSKKETTISTSRTFSLYDETARISSEQTFETGGSFPVFSAGIRVFKNFGIGAALNSYSAESDGSVTASVPHPLVYDQPRTANATVTGLKHSARAFHLMALYVLPITNKFDVTVSAGPTFFSVEQGTINAASAQVGTDVAPYTTVTLTSVNKVTTKQNKTGFNIGADAAFKVTRYIGLGVYARYAKTTVEFTPDGLAEGLSIDAGGAQFGGGLRIRF
jgi:hypothetical protein